jgi:hypothetical protein
MDPYLEPFWGDLHHRLITYACDSLQEELPGDLLARMDERVFVEPADGTNRKMVPDVRVIEHGRREQPGLTASSGVAVAEPLVLCVEEDEPIRQGFIEILDLKSGRRVVTVIEILSPANRLSGPGRELYVKKQEELRAGGVSLVEIDLVRTGPHVLTVPFECIPVVYRTPYAVCVRRGWQPRQFEYYPISLRERLPAIAIPLRRDDRDVPLDLQPLVDRCYQAGRYGYDIDYSEEPEPRLAPTDAQWVDMLLRERGLREKPAS